MRTTRGTGFWIAVDLLMVLVVAAFGACMASIATGTWWPFGWMQFSYWSLLAFVGWLVMLTGVAITLGLQYASMSAAKEERSHSSVHARALSSRTVPAPTRTAVSALGDGHVRQGPAAGSALLEMEEEMGAELAAAGR